MNAPRLVLHALLAGLYGALLVALLLLRMNPAPGHGGEGGAGLALLLVVVPYTLASGLLWSLLYGAVRFFASHPLHVPRLSLRYLLAFHGVNTAVVLASAWISLSRSRRVLSPEAIDGLALLCLSLSLAWVVAAAVSILPVLRRRRSLQILAGGLALLALVVPAALQPKGGTRPAAGSRPALLPAPSGRLLLLNFDGADLDTILTLLAQGKLPAFNRLREEGIYGRLRSIRPCEAAVTRTTLATGRRPYRHGVRGGLSRRIAGRGPEIQVVPFGLGFDLLLGPILKSRPTSILDRKGHALWELAAQVGGTAEAAGFEIDLDAERTLAAGPEDAAAAIQAGFIDSDVLRRADPSLRAPLRDLVDALQADARLEPALDHAARDPRPGIAALSFPGLDRVAHVFLRQAHPQEFGNVTTHEIELYGEVLERYYRRVDGLVGRALLAAEGAWLVVTSSHGMDPLPLRERIVRMAIGSEAWSGTHEGGPDGFLFVRGPGVGRGPLAGKGTILDVVPTALYALRLPVARDLDGAILTSVFTPRYILAHPVTVIGSYEDP